MKAFAILAAVLILTLCGYATAKHFWRGETMSPSNVEKTWGNASFDAKKFREGDIKTRAQMAKSLLTSKKYLGKTTAEVRAELGNWDGYYFTDMFPAYLIQEGDGKNRDSWQIVFLLDRKYRVAELIVHKNCCDK